MSTQIIRESSPDRLFEGAADALVGRLTRFPGDAPLVLGLCGGRSIVGLLNALLRRIDSIPGDLWPRLQFFMIDERLVPLDDDQSNYKLVNELFFGPALAQGVILPSQVHPFVDDRSAPDRGIGRYQEELERAGGVMHLVFLGVGEDGHVAALFPRSAALRSPDPFFVTMDQSPKPPPERMTATVGLISQASLAVALFIGASKRGALENYRDPTLDLADCPVKVIDRVAERLIVTDLEPSR